jgi:hypothetical protein
MATIHSINKALFALGILFILANLLLPHYRAFPWFGSAGVFLILLSAVLSFYLIRDQKTQITAHKEQIALHESRIAAQDAQISGHKTEMAGKDLQISDMKANQTKSAQDVPPLAATPKPAVENAVPPAIAPENQTSSDEVSENK